jgi:hypothetical protein
MPETQVYVDLGKALYDIELHKPYRTVFGLWRCEWCQERCKRAGCPIRLAATAFFDEHASPRDREWYTTSHPHAGLFSETEVHSILGLDEKPEAAPIRSAKAAKRRTARAKRRARGDHRRGRRPSPGPRADRRHDYPMESPTGAGL